MCREVETRAGGPSGQRGPRYSRATFGPYEEINAQNHSEGPAVSCGPWGFLAYFTIPPKQQDSALTTQTLSALFFLLLQSPCSSGFPLVQNVTFPLT